MADPQRGDEFPEDEEGGGESTVSMASPMLDPSGMPSPISAPPAAGAPPMPNLSIPTAPAFTPQAPFAMSGKRPGPPQPSVPTPFGGLTPGAPPPKPLPAAGAPPPRNAAPAPQATGAAGAPPPGIKRPQTVIGLAPPPVGSPRPGQAGARGVPLPSSGGKPMAPRAGAAPGVPPSSGRGVTPAKPPSSGKPLSPSSAEGVGEGDTDSRYSPSKQGRESVPDSHKEDFATMAKSPEESLALFGLDSGVSDAARAAVGAKPGVAAKPPPGRSPLASTNLAAPGKPIGPSSSRPGGGAPPPIPPPSSQPQAPAKDIAVLHDRNEEEESTRAVSREEMLRGHDSVVIGEDSEAHGEDATLAIAPGFNEANSSQAAAFAATLAKDAGSHPGAPPPPPGFDPNFGQPPPPAPPHGTHGMPANQGWQQPPPMAPQHGWQDPNAYQQQQQQGHSNPQSYPGMAVGPVSGPHLPAQSWTPNPPGSQPHFPAGAPQSQPHMQVAQNANQPIPYPGQPGLQQLNPFDASRRKSKVSGQIILLGIVGVVCLAIFITGIVLFATTKF